MGNSFSLIIIVTIQLFEYQIAALYYARKRKRYFLQLFYTCMSVNKNIHVFHSVLRFATAATPNPKPVHALTNVLLISHMFLTRSPPYSCSRTIYIRLQAYTTLCIRPQLSRMPTAGSTDRT